VTVSYSKSMKDKWHLKHT